MTTLIQQYWDSRAQHHRHSPAATTSDIHLRELEYRVLQQQLAALKLPAGARVLDAGCGDGATTARLAHAFPELLFHGIDFAPSMIQSAQRNLKESPNLASRVQFTSGDVTQLDASSFAGRFDVATTCRCLINLGDLHAQQKAMEQIAACLGPRGTYLAIENFHEGHERMNAARLSIGLPAIPVRWHNCYFSEQEFRDAARVHFQRIEFVEFASAYYYATRVIYARMCQMRGEEPDYDHDIHRLAVDLPPHGCYSPVRLAILQRQGLNADD